MSVVRLVLAALIAAWVMGALGVPGLQDAFRARHLPATFAELTTLAGETWLRGTNLIDSHPLYVFVLAVVLLIVLFRR